jgi:hypothetical protein
VSQRAGHGVVEEISAARLPSGVLVQVIALRRSAVLAPESASALQFRDHLNQDA